MATAKPNPKAKKKVFKDAASVTNVIQPMQNIERLRANDRAKIDALFNGKRPYSEEEVKKFNIQINVNWGTGKRVMRDANTQLNSALLHPGTLFTCAPEKGQVDKRDAWGQIFTTNIHKPLQRGHTGQRVYFTIKSRNASICMHGIGALLWTTNFKWMPRFVPMEDLLIPTGTYCDFGNLRYFAVNEYLTPGELVDMAMGDNAHPGWNRKMVEGILDSMREQFSESFPSTWRDQPEELEQIFKGNHGYYYSDAVPKIRARWFFYQEVDKPNKWYRCMILREAYGDVKPDEAFLFDGTDRPFANNISEILAVQYGDNNLVPRLKFHDVRGLGVDLFGPVETLNRLQCQLVQSTFEHLLMYFRIQDPNDRDRLKQIVLSQYGVLPEGLNIVPRQDRHQIDPNLVDNAMNQMRQYMQESSSSYVQNIQDGTNKEMTAREATIKLNQATVMVSSMLQSLYLQEGFYYEEIVRRFCNKASSDPDVKKFQSDCIKAGIPEALVYDHTVWKVTPERVLGGGDQSQAQIEAGWLWDNAPAFDPSVQPTLRRMAVGAILRDPNKAALLVPLAKPEATDGTMAAEDVFGTLMQGQQCSLRKGIDQIGYVETLIKMAASVVQRISSTGNVGTQQELIGLGTVLQNIQVHIQVIAQDKRNNQLVKQMGDAMGQLANALKGFMQRLSEQQQQQAELSQIDPAAEAKARATLQMATVKSQIAQQTAAQKNAIAVQKFQSEQQRANLKTASDLQRNQELHNQDLHQQAQEHALDMILEANKPVDKSGN